jgi:hypothetical protein
MVARQAPGLKKRAHQDVGIPADRYLVELRGRTYFVINRDTLGLMGVYPTRDQAQVAADRLNVTFREARRG